MKAPSIGLAFFVGAAVLCSLQVGPQKALANDLDEEVYQRKLEHLNERYRDFFIHEQMKKRYNEERRSDAYKMKEIRKQRAEEREKYRQERVRNRKAKPDPERFRSEYEEELKEQAEKRKKHLKSYIKRRDALRRLKSQAKKIPENKEAGLE